MKLYWQVVGMNKSQWQGWICYALLTLDFIEILEMTMSERNLRELRKSLIFNISTIIWSAALKVHMLVIDITGNEQRKRRGHATFALEFINILEMAIWEKIFLRGALRQIFIFHLLFNCR